MVVIINQSLVTNPQRAKPTRLFKYDLTGESTILLECEALFRILAGLRELLTRVDQVEYVFILDPELLCMERNEGRFGLLLVLEWMV